MSRPAPLPTPTSDDCAAPHRAAGAPASASALLNRLLARGKFRHVQVLLQLAELGSVQRAAQAIGTTQSSVTQMLAYVEGLLETPLFERHARGVRPTTAGRDLLPVARQLMSGLQEGAELMATRLRGRQGAVRLAASAAGIHGLVQPVLAGFAAAHPEVEIHLTEAEGEEQLLAIARQEVDLVACRRPLVIPQGWTFEPLREDAFAVVCRPDHPAAQRARDAGPGTACPWQDLAGHAWLLPPAGTNARVRFDQLFAALGCAPRLHPLITRSPSLLQQLLPATPVLSFLPRHMMRPQLDAGLVVEIAVQPASPIAPLGLLRPLNALGAPAQLLADALRQRFRAESPAP